MTLTKYGKRMLLEAAKKLPHDDKHFVYPICGCRCKWCSDKRDALRDSRSLKYCIDLTQIDGVTLDSYLDN